MLALARTHARSMWSVSRRCANFGYAISMYRKMRGGLKRSGARVMLVIKFYFATDGIDVKYTYTWSHTRTSVQSSVVSAVC